MPNAHLEVPAELVDAIVRGRCVAFIGAGFVFGAVPDWVGLLGSIAALVGHEAQEAVRPLIGPATKGSAGPRPTALELEAAAQILRDMVTDGVDEGALAWEMKVHQALEHGTVVDSVETRVRLLREIPFRALLTTNFDRILDPIASGPIGDDLGPAAYAAVLRNDQRWWERSEWRGAGSRMRTPLVKLHGNADGTLKHPVVLARTDYRRRLYEDHRYANFVRSVFSQYTILFLGVSFTDAYLNELRSEVLSFIGVPGGSDGKPWGYAVRSAEESPPAMQEFMVRHEGIEVLPYSVVDGSHDGFDDWLAAIAAKTSADARLDQLLGTQEIIWIDPMPGNNTYGMNILAGGPRHGKGALGRVVTCLNGAKDLRDEHRNAALVITHFGHRALDESVAHDVLERIRGWPIRPPVVVFASENEKVAENRLKVLRRGASEYVTRWAELFESIERIFGRR